jgi:hypothetical protein
VLILQEIAYSAPSRPTNRPKGLLRVSSVLASSGGTGENSTPE